MSEEISKYFKEVKDIVDTISRDDINNVIKLLNEARLSGKRIFIVGNGGSASTATHFACDLNKYTSVDKEKRFSVRKWIVDDLEELLSDEDWASTIVGVDLISSAISKCEEPLELHIDDVRELPSGDILLAFSARLYVEMCIDFDGRDYDRNYEAMCDLVGEPDGQMGYCTAWTPIEVNIEVSLVLEKNTLKVKSSQVDYIEGRNGYCQANPHPSREK